MFTERDINRIITLLLAERKRLRAERVRRSVTELPPATVPAGDKFFRVFTIDYRFTMLDLATEIYGDQASSKHLRRALTELATACGAVKLGKARVNRGDGEAQVDLAYSVTDWETFRARLQGALSKEQDQ